MQAKEDAKQKTRGNGFKDVSILVPSLGDIA